MLAPGDRNWKNISPERMLRHLLTFIMQRKKHKGKNYNYDSDTRI